MLIPWRVYDTTNGKPPTKNSWFFCPGATTSATSVSMAAEEVAKSAEALFPHRTPWGGGTMRDEGMMILKWWEVKMFEILIVSNFLTNLFWA